MMQVTRAAFQAVASLNKQATDPKSHTLVSNFISVSLRSRYLLNSDGRPRFPAPFLTLVVIKVLQCFPKILFCAVCHQELIQSKWCFSMGFAMQPKLRGLHIFV